MIDMRSDTVTKPTAAMRRAMADAEVGDDVLDGDPTTRRLEAVVAEHLGVEAALFFPSGTMANQVAVWVLSTPGTEVFVDEYSHIVHWEMSGLAALCGVQNRVVPGAPMIMTATGLAKAIRRPDASASHASLVCVENTHAWAGGVITPIEELRAIRDIANGASLPLHLDGARLWHAAEASGTALSEYAACADLVMVSLSKGLGAPVGSALAGSRDLIDQAHRARKRFGGGMRQSGVLAAAALHGLTHHLPRLKDDHEGARLLAKHVDGVGGAAVVWPDTNIVMIDLPTPSAGAVVQRAGELGVRISDWTDSRIRAVTHLDAPVAAIPDAARRIAQALEEVLTGASANIGVGQPPSPASVHLVT